MTKSAIELETRRLVDSVKDFLQRSLDNLKIDIGLAKTLDARLSQLEEGRVMRWLGAYDPALQPYGPGSVVQRAGGVWVALVSTSEAPGSSDSWRRIGSS